MPIIISASFTTGTYIHDTIIKVTMSWILDIGKDILLLENIDGKVGYKSRMTIFILLNNTTQISIFVNTFLNCG